MVGTVLNTGDSRRGTGGALAHAPPQLVAHGSTRRYQWTKMKGGSGSASSLPSLAGGGLQWRPVKRTNTQNNTINGSWAALLHSSYDCPRGRGREPPWMAAE